MLRSTSQAKPSKVSTLSASSPTKRKIAVKSTPKTRKTQRFFSNRPQSQDSINHPSSSDYTSLLATKNLTKAELSAEYLPTEVEAHWNDYWTKSQLFEPTLLRKNKFVILLPPPNVTGTLHLGHALTVAIQDALTRYHRMKGNSALWVPGVDHAGIATQVVVEKNLKKLTGQSRHDLGREQFLKKVWEWKESYGDTIFSQLRKLGTSLDWTRTRFTLDETCHDAVMEAFVKLHDMGTIYRDNRLVTWCCTLRSAISSIEIDSVEIDKPMMMKIPNYHKEVEVGVIHDFKYKIVSKKYARDVQDGVIAQQSHGVPDESDSASITVSTTRIETMLGDVAVAVHPDDPRYAQFKSGDYVLEHPLVPNYFIPVIFDDVLVDMNFGTGAVKITPAHDPNDHQCALRHNLPMHLSLLNDNGDFSHPFFDKFNGKHRYDVRDLVIEELTQKKCYGGKKPNPMVISICSRSGDIIEPMAKPQWWISSANMALTGKDSADNGSLTFTPQNSYNDWSRWLENHQDWCISRQLWWGHRIPAWYIHFENDEVDMTTQEDPKRWVIARSEAEANEKVHAIIKEKFPGRKLQKLTQDEDVLDTWFSSGLFPFSVMGWPHNGVKTDPSNPNSKRNKDFLRFFPGTLLETGNDILFFWVARMVMLSQTLTGLLPFNHVYLHTLIRDKLGRKMSKSLGNVIDPLDVINGVELSQLHEKLLTSNLPKDEVEKAKNQQRVDFPEGIPSCGSDSLRFGLLSYTKQSGDINLDIQTVITSRQFHNKIWQAMRFAMMNIQDNEDIFSAPINGFYDIENVLNDQYAVLKQQHMEQSPHTPFDESLKHGTFEQQWILHKLSQVIEHVNSNFETYSMGETTGTLQRFFMEDLCSRYLEISKSVVRKNIFKDGKNLPNNDYNPIIANAQLNVLYYCIETFFKLLHPISPYLTEQLWFSLPGHKNRIAAQTKSFSRDVLSPISHSIAQIPIDVIQGSNSGNLDATIRLNTHIHQSLLSLPPAQRTKMNQFVDLDVFDPNTYHQRLAQIKSQNAPNAPKYEINPLEQMLSLNEIQSELQSVEKRIQSGSISIQPFPSVSQTVEQTHRFDEHSGELTRVGTGLQPFHDNVQVSAQMEKLMDVIDRIRGVKARLQIPNHVKPQVVLEYIQSDNAVDQQTVDNNLENDIMTNLSAYQHIISILSFVSNPKTIQTTQSTCSVSAAPSEAIQNITNKDRTGPKSYAIKQYISERVLVHIIVPQSDSQSAEADNVESNPIDIDFSPELVKSERRFDYLSVYSKQLESNIEKTKDNPKVPEKVKIKNATDYAAAINEMVILKANMQSLKHIVPEKLYIPTKIDDLGDQIGLLNKGREKIEGVIQVNLSKGKGSANEKHQAELDAVVRDIAAFERQIASLRAKIG